jgi:hypothetical protein
MIMPAKCAPKKDDEFIRERHDGIIVFAMIIVAGCATQIPEIKQATVAKIGCQESAIKISNSSVGAKESSWDAECEGKTYHCTGDEQLRGVSCLEKK